MESFKRCGKCGEIKYVDEFHSSKTFNDGLGYYCKSCFRVQLRDYRRTKSGLLASIYSNQRSSSKRRGHPYPSYSSSEFTDRYINDKVFISLYDNWVKGGYKKLMRPSFDRANDNRGYSFSNLNKWMTWDDNRAGGFRDRKNGVNNKTNKSVVGINLNNGQKVEYFSLSEAARRHNVKQCSISNSCSGRINSAAGFAWKLKEA